MEGRQLEWQWQRVHKPKRPAPKPAPRPAPRPALRPAPRPAPRPRRPPPPPPPDTSERLEEGLRDLERFIREVGGGRIGPLQVRGATLTVGLRAADDELYHLRIVTRAYPSQPPSCTFVDAEGQPTPTSWPGFNPSGPFRPPHFICTPPTAEFFRYHSERRYEASEGTLVNTVCTIFTALNAPAYRGRFSGRREPPRRGRVRRR
jgi:hypothetical protein